MKIHRPGDPLQFPSSNPAARWVGMKFVCPQCQCKAEVEATDQPSFGNRSGSTSLTLFFRCPTPDCDELIYLEQLPIRIVDFRGTTISTP